MQCFMEWTNPDGTRIRWYEDEEYTSAGSFAGEDDAHTRELEEWERKRIESGELVALGYILERECPTCQQWETVDSLWGIVLPPTEEALRQYFVDTSDPRPASWEKE